MKLLPIFGFMIVLVGLKHCTADVVSVTNSTSTSTRKDSSVGVIGPPSQDAERRISKDILKSSNSTDGHSTSPANQQKKRSMGKVHILEAGSKNRGESRILKRGPRPPPIASRFTDSIFTLRNSLQAKQALHGFPKATSSYGGNSMIGGGSSGPPMHDEFPNIPVIEIPGSHIPPPVYAYGSSEPPAPPPSTGGGSYGISKPTGVSSYKPVGGIGGSVVMSTTSTPEIILPPEIVTPVPPRPIGPGTGHGTSVPIIGGGGGVLPPSPDEISPPAPPPDDEMVEELVELNEDDQQVEEVDVGRRLKVKSGSSVGNARANGASLRTRTRVTPIPKASSVRSSAKDVKTSSKEQLRGGILRRERLRDKVKEFKTSALSEDDNEEVEEITVDDPNVITDFVFSDIKCFKTRQNEYFGATIHMKNGFHLPYVRDRPQDPLSSEECRLEQMEGTRGSYHMAVTDLRGCGVEQCGEAMCLTMVFPRVPMLALADDEVTTIKCIPQKSTMSDTKSISFAGDSMENRRSSSTVEGGIQEFVAEVGVFRQNPGASNSLFVKRVNSGGVVQLGESLQLRSVVRGTDGWKHSKLTDVKVWRMRDNMSHRLDNLDPNEASEVITLVDGQGCRNDEYLVIADDHPIKDPRNDMVHHFTFKAFLFRGQRVNEPLIVTARVHACQESHDCIMECESEGRRTKRSPIELHNASAIVHGFDSQLALRVVGLNDHPSSFLDDFDHDAAISQKDSNQTLKDLGMMTCNEKMVATGLGGGCVMLLICGLALALYTYIKKGRVQTKTSQHSSGTYPYPPPARLRSGTSSNATNTPYHKPLPPPPSSQQQQSSSQNTTSQEQSGNKPINADISEVAKLLQQLANNEGNKNKIGGGSQPSKSEGKHHAEPSSEYACIDETNSSASTSSEDLSKSNKKDGLYIVYCYNKDKKNKIMLPLSAPSSMRMRRKHLKHNVNEDDDDDEELDFIDEDDSETMGSQTEEATEESDDSYTVRNESNGIGNNNKNQGCRRTVRSVKKKSKQNNHLANASTRSGVRRRVSSVYREGYLQGIRGASSRGGSFPLRYKKSPSTGNLPAATSSGYNQGQGSTSTKRIHFSVRERKSGKNKRHQKQHSSELYSSDGILASDLDSAYSGSNCSKLTEDHLYEMKRGDTSCSGRYPDFRNYHKLRNLLNVQHQLRNGTQGQQTFLEKQEVRRANSTNTVTVGLESPPLPLGKTKATHFVTRDDSTTKILIVPETHV